MAKPSRPSDNICLDAHAVQHCVSYSLQQIGRLEAAGKFPKRIRLGPHRVGWSFREILDWMQSKVDARPVGPMSPKVTIGTADRFIHPKELRAMVLYSRNHVRNLEATGKFPRHIWLSDNRVVWLEREVKEWLDEQRARGAADLKTYHVQLCRPRFEVAVVAIEATSPSNAEAIALTSAKNGKSGWRVVPYEPDVYRPHVEISVLEEEPAYERGAAEKILNKYRERFIRYLVFYADTNTYNAKVIFQPWFNSETLGRFARDLAGTWTSEIVRVPKSATKLTPTKKINSRKSD